MTDDTQGPHFTLVFRGDIRRFDGNPFRTATPFGEPMRCGEGDAFVEIASLEDVSNTLADALIGLMQTFPRSGRSTEQVDAFLAATRAVQSWRDQ